VRVVFSKQRWQFDVNSGEVMLLNVYFVRKHLSIFFT
jgi:hypothetical protein